MSIFPYSRQKISSSDIKAVKQVLESELLTQGPLVEKFEKKFSQFVNSKYSTAVNSATSALYIACAALNFKKNDILWTSCNTFVSSANCGVHLGGKIDLLDIDYETGNIDVNLLEKKLQKAKKRNKLPKIIIPVHFSGIPTEQDKIWNLSKKYKFKIIEDASHSLGSKYKKNITGNCKWSHITIFSLHPVKIITTAEGGVATTNDKYLNIKMQMLKNSGITKNKNSFINKKKGNNDWYYEQQILGMNMRMNEISAALGLSQLRNVKKFVVERNKIARFYNKTLDSKFLLLPKVRKDFYSSFHLYLIKIKSKNYKYLQKKLFRKLRKNNFFVQVHYLPVHQHPYYKKKFDLKDIHFSRAIKHSESSISIPIFPGLKNKTLFKICNLINNFFKINQKSISL